MNGTEMTTAEDQQEENQSTQQDGRLQIIDTRYETMEKHLNTRA